MDKEDGNPSAFFWHKREFEHPNDDSIQIRIGMSAKGLSYEQQEELLKIYKLADVLRKEYPKDVHYSRVSYSVVIERIQEEVQALLQPSNRNKMEARTSLQWIQMILKIAKDIIENSPPPLTIVSDNGQLEHVSSAYSAMVGYRVSEIIEPGFFDRLYLNIE
jgi:PAS domain-containing protein